MSPAGYAQGDPITEGSLYRRIPPLDGYYVHDLQRPSSLAFLPDTDDEYVSMVLASVVRPEQVLDSNKPGIKIAKKIAHRAIVIQPPVRR